MLLTIPIEQPEVQRLTENTVGYITLSETVVANQPPVETAWVFPRIIVNTGIAGIAEHDEKEIHTTSEVTTIYKTEAEAKAALEGTRSGAERINKAETPYAPREETFIENKYALTGAGKNELKHTVVEEIFRSIFPLEVHFLIELIVSSGAVWTFPINTTMRQVKPNAKLPFEEEAQAWGPVSAYLDLTNPLLLLPGQQLTLRVRAACYIGSGFSQIAEVLTWLTSDPKSRRRPLQVATNPERGNVTLLYAPQPYDRNQGRVSF